MPKPWKEVAASPAYWQLQPQQQEEARQQYFNEVVAPQLTDPTQTASAKAEFDASYGPSAQSRISTQDADLYSHNGPVERVRGNQPIDRIEAMIKGNAAENLPAISGFEFADAGQHSLRNIGMGVAGIFGTDAQYGQAAQGANPGSELTQDANGNSVLQLKDGRRFYVNQPGLDTDDVLRGMAKAAPFLAAGGVAAIPESLLGRLAAGAVASGGADAAEQLTASSGATGNPSLNLGQSVLAAGIGGAAELVPAVGNSLVNAWSRGGISDTTAATRGAMLAQSANIPGSLTNEQLIALGRYLPQIKGGASPESALAESEFGFKLTQGQKTGDPRQLMREEMLRAGTSPSARRAQQVMANQESNTADQVQRIQDYLAGGRAPSSPVEAAQTVMGSAQSQASALKDQINTAYDAARNTNAAVTINEVQTLPQRLSASVSDFDITPELTPSTYRQLSRIQDTIGQLPPTTSGVTLRALESNRKIINNAIDSAPNAADRTALGNVKKAYDQWIGDAFDNALITGDAQALETLKQARSLRAEYGARFQPGNPNDQGGKIVKQLLDDNATPDKMAQAIFGAGQLAPQASASVVWKLRKALGNDQDAWNAVRSAFINRAVTNQAGEVAGPQAIVNNLQRLLRERPALVKQLYSSDEIGKLQRFATAMKVLVPQKALTNNSHTFDKALAFFNEYLSSIPFGEKLVSMVSAPRRAATAAKMTAPVVSQPSNVYRQLLGAGGQGVEQHQDELKRLLGPDTDEQAR